MDVMNYWCRIWGGLLTCLCFLSTNVIADENQIIRFNVAPNGHPPFMIIDEQGHVSGIMYDVLSQIAESLNYTVEPMRIPRKRVGRMVINNELDASPSAIEWTEKPERFIFTDEIVAVQDVLVFPTRSTLEFNNVEDLFGHSILTRLGFYYPTLERHFSSGRIERIDGADNVRMLAKQLRHPERFAGVLMNKSVALWLIKQQGWKGRFVTSKTAVSEVAYRIMFGLQWTEFVENFNQHLNAMKSDGRLATILSRYQ